jgi:pimeloyl-ACP methyl ester carboxylesterase
LAAKIEGHPLRREIRNLLIILAGALAIGSASSAGPVSDPNLNPQRLVRLPDGRRMNLYCLGAGAPTVVLDAGWNGGVGSWSSVQSTLAKTTRTCAFDRAGLGFSDPGRLPRDTRAIVSDLHQMLQAAHIPGPYVLVGHSMGALDVRLYASLHAKDAAGMVLVDPASEHQSARMSGSGDPMLAKLKACAEAAEAGKLVPGAPEDARCAPAPRASLPEPIRARLTSLMHSPSYHRTILSEYENIATRDSDEIDAARTPFGDMPLIVLTAEKTGLSPGMSLEQQAAVAGMWRAMHDETATLSRRGENRLVMGSGHLIQVDRPDAVVAAVDEVVAAARKH